MNVENLQKWVTELRTTKERQATEYLCGPASGGIGYCCLGIGLKMLDPNHMDLSPESEGMVPVQFVEWLGLDTSDREFPDGWQWDVVLDIPPQYDLADDDRPEVTVTAGGLNDMWHLTFSQIADMLAYFGLKGAVT